MRGLGIDIAQQIVDDYLADIGRHTCLTEPQLEALATVGALAAFTCGRRTALSQVALAAWQSADQLPDTTNIGDATSVLPGMSP